MIRRETYVYTYDTAGTKLVSYKYDAWGNFSKTSHNGGSSTRGWNNPITYRGYYYDGDISLYVLGTRYYDPVTGRFLSPDAYDVVSVTPMALTDKNLYSYCDNNPVMRCDYGGTFWETLFDISSFASSVAEVFMNPGDALAWIGLVGDVVDFIPFVSGVGELADLMHATAKVDGIIDTTKSIDTFRNVKKATKGTGLEVHHIVEKRFAKNLCIKNTNDMLSIALNSTDHRLYTNALRKEIGYNTGTHSPHEIWTAAQRIYADRPDLLEAARLTIFRR